MNRFIIAGAIMTLGVVALAIWAYWPAAVAPTVVVPPTGEDTTVVVATSTRAQIGASVESRPIEVYTFGTGETDLLFVGGVHGGYEANTVRLAEAMIEEFQLRPAIIPPTVTVHIVPVLNPDGYAKALDPTTNYTDQAKRFNANGVDLNRNFDCKWAPQSSWRGQIVDAGSAAFSEPEAVALRDYVLATQPNAAVFWHSIANTVYGSECEQGILSATRLLMNTYATAANYNTVEQFDAYPITGDAEGWLATLGIPAITVELETRESIEWERNWTAMLATLELYR